MLLFSDVGTGGPGGPLAPQYFADRLTLFEPGRAEYPHLLLLAPPMFFTFRHHCTVIPVLAVVLGYCQKFRDCQNHKTSRNILVPLLVQEITVHSIPLEPT